MPPVTIPAVTTLALQCDGERVVAHISGSGSPLLLIHSVNAAASAAETEPLRAHYAGSRTVCCIDLPGFGDSERSDRHYSPTLMTAAIVAVARHLCAQSQAPIDALALSLSCEFLARAASQHPNLFRTLALVSPTGFSGQRAWRAAPGQTRGKAWLYALLRGPGWGGGLYRLLTRPKVIRYFLQRTWGSKHIDEPLWHTDIEMARRPGAQFAPLHFLAGNLFSADIHDVYDSLRGPVWVTHGVRGDFVDYRQLSSFAERLDWRVSVFNTGALPHFEALAPFIDDYDRLLA